VRVPPAASFTDVETDDLVDCARMYALVAVDICGSGDIIRCETDI
jgi:hypothetical protein